MTSVVFTAAETRSTPDGSFSFDGLAPGEVLLRVERDAEDNERWAYVPGPPVKLESGKTTQVTVKVARSVKVSGRVTEKSTGKTLKGASVLALVKPASEVEEVETGRALTDERGRFTLYLAPGKHRLFASADVDGRRLRGEQVIAAKEGKDIELPGIAITLVRVGGY